MSHPKRLLSTRRQSDRVARFARAASEALEPRRMLSASLLADINLDTPSSNPSQFTRLGGEVLFVAGTPGPQVWKTDGSAAGTSLIVNGNSDFSTVLMPALSDDVALFFNGDITHGRELWRTDGTSVNTSLVKDINPGIGNSWTSTVGTAAVPPNNPIVMNGVIYFQATDGSAAHGSELWRSDGTEAGTYLVEDILAGTSSSSPSYQTRIGDVIYFSAVDNSGSVRRLSRTDGTDAGTYALSTTLGGVREFIAVGNTLFFFALADGSTTQYVLYKTDGTPGNATAISTALTLAGSASGGPTLIPMAVVGNTLFFSAAQGTSGTELWKSDGTTTQMVKDLFSGANSSTPQQLLAHDGRLFFTAIDDVHNFSRVLYTSDGTPQGTNFIDVAGAEPTITSSSNLSGVLASLNGFVYFAANDAAHGLELWRSDGSGAGTSNVTDGLAEKTGAINLAAINGALYFAGADVTLGVEPFRSDGTAAGTGLIKDIYPAQNLSSSPSNFFVSSAAVAYFSASRGATGGELWRTDGTPAGTCLLKDINPGVGSSSPGSFVEVGGIVYFIASDAAHGGELWRTDGSAAGTFMVTDIRPGANTGATGPITVDGSTLYVEGYDAAGAMGMYKSNGTAAGTSLVKSFGGGFIYDIVPYNGSLYVTVGTFQAQRLWKSDGTEAGTSEMFAAGTGPTGTSSLVVAGGTLFFVAKDSQNTFELWKTNGTVAGTAIVKEINATGDANPHNLTEFGGKLSFWAYSPQYGYELWQTNGTSSGTTQVKDINTNGSSPTRSPTSPLVAGGGWLYFAADDGFHGFELWRSNGLATEMVRDLWVGSQSGLLSTPNLAWFHGRLYFDGYDGGSRGRELYSTDATRGLTILAADIPPSTGSSSPSKLTPLGNTLIFSANGAGLGTELWRYAPPVVTPGGPYTVNEGSSIPLSLSATDPYGQAIVAYDWDFHYEDPTFLVTDTGASPTFNAGLYHNGHDRTEELLVRLTDASGGQSLAVVPVFVANVAPTIELGGDIYTSAGRYFQPTFAFSDPGSEYVAGTAQFGVGTTPQYLVGTRQRTVTLSRWTPAAEEYLLTVTVTDEDGAQASDSVMVHVSAALPAGVTSPNEGRFYIQDGKFIVSSRDIVFDDNADLANLDLVARDDGRALLNTTAGQVKSITTVDVGYVEFVADTGLSLRTGSIALSGRMDIRKNRLIVTDQSPAAVENLLRLGYAGGAWTGPGGIGSVVAGTGGGLYSLGAATAAQVLGLAPGETAVWAGQTASASDVLVRYTYGGDINLDGRINVDDYGRIDTHVGLGVAGYFNGDVNFDGKINVDDYGIIDVNVGIQGPPLASAPVGEIQALSQFSRKRGEDVTTDRVIDLLSQ